MTLIALFLAFALTRATPAPQPTTPGGCVKAARDFAQTQQRAAKQLTTELVRQVQADKVVLAQKCAAQFKPDTIPAAEIADLIALYGEAAEPTLAKATLERALGMKALDPGARGKVLVQAVSSGLREPKSAERNARLERYVDDLDAIPGDLLDLKISVHSSMNGYYRADDIDDGIIKHSTWLIQRAREFTPEQRPKYGYTIINAHINMAEVLAGRGHTDRATALLAAAKTGWADIPDSARSLDPVIARYALVGAAAAPITAPRWLSAPANTTMPMTGAVTLLEFTAHWCGPCKESYPGIRRLLATYGSQGFRVVFATELYGYFGTERPLTAEVEFERDREYFAHEGLLVPVAVGDARALPVRGPDGSYAAARNPNDAAYEVGAIPQIHLIDKRGRIRLIMVGYDEVNEPAVAAMIEKLLKEK